MDTEEHLLRLREHQEQLKAQIRAAEARVVEYNEEVASASPARSSSVRYYQRGTGEDEREEFDPSPRRERYQKSPRHPNDFTGRVLCVAGIDDPPAAHEIPAPIHGSPARSNYSSPPRVNVNNHEITTSDSPNTTRQTRAGLWTSPTESTTPHRHIRTYRSYGDTERPVPPPMH